MKHSAFTLLELLVVITIMGVIVAAIVLNFAGIRTQQQLSLLADKSLALLQTAQTEVRSGKYDFESAEYLCEGGHFVEGSESKAIHMPYDSMNEVCDFDGDVVEEEYGLPTSPALIGEMSVEGGSVGELYAVFLPPEGNLQLFDGSGTALTGAAKITFTANTSTPFGFSLQLSTLSGVITLSSQHEE